MAITVRDTELKPGYKQTEIGMIPEDWEVTPLTGLAVIQHGYGFQSQYFKPFGKYCLTTPGHFHETGGFRNVGEKQKFYEGPLPEGYLLSEDDLIVAMTEQTDGLLGSAAIVPIGNTYLHNQRLGKVKVLSPNLSIRFLYCIFNSDNYRAKVRETAAGTKVKHTSPSKLLEIPIPLPSTKAEQQAIATALSDIDALITSLDKLIAKKRDIKQATMQELLTGKIRLPGFNEKWNWKKLGDVVSINMGQSPDSKNYNSSSIGMPLIQGNADIEKRKSISRVWTTQITKTCNIGDLIMTVRAPVGSVGIATRDSCLGRGVCSLKPIKDDRHFMFHLMVFFEDKWKMIGQGSTFDSANSSQITEFSVVITPSLIEQQAIATILSDMDAEIVSLEQKRDKTRALKQGMMQELLTGKTRLYDYSRPDRTHDAESSGQSLTRSTEI